MNFLYGVLAVGLGSLIIYWIYAEIRDRRKREKEKKNGKR